MNNLPQVTGIFPHPTEVERNEVLADVLVDGAIGTALGTGIGVLAWWRWWLRTEIVPG